MNIQFCPPLDVSSAIPVICPGCLKSHCRRHGYYTRTGFHTRNGEVAIPLAVQRYLCLNTECSRCTFSILPPRVLRYSRFFWPCLLALEQALATGSTPYHQARHVWHVGWGVIVRARALLNRLTPWVEKLHQEHTDGGPIRGLGSMVKIITGKITCIELLDQWYRHCYPLRSH